MGGSDSPLALSSKSLWSCFLLAPCWRATSVPSLSHNSQQPMSAPDSDAALCS